MKIEDPELIWYSKPQRPLQSRNSLVPTRLSSKERQSVRVSTIMSLFLQSTPCTIVLSTFTSPRCTANHTPHTARYLKTFPLPHSSKSLDAPLLIGCILARLIHLIPLCLFRLTDMFKVRGVGRNHRGPAVAWPVPGVRVVLNEDPLPRLQPQRCTLKPSSGSMLTTACRSCLQRGQGLYGRWTLQQCGILAVSEEGECES